MIKATQFGIGSLQLVFWLLVAPLAHGEWARPADPATSTTSELGRYRAAYVSTLKPLKINQIHSWTIHVHNAEGEPVENAELVISGGMPAHDHGLPTAPRVTASFGNGAYFVDGMKFHMRGVWEVVVQISAEDGEDTVTWEIKL